MKRLLIYFIAAMRLALALSVEQNATGRDFWVFLKNSPQQVTAQSFAQTFNLPVIQTAIFDGMNIFKANLNDSLVQRLQSHTLVSNNLTQTDSREKPFMLDFERSSNLKAHFINDVMFCTGGLNCDTIPQHQNSGYH
jgi:hypothetical protein